MDNFQKLHFMKMFDLVEPNPFEASYDSNIVEYTINVPRTKLKNKSRDDQIRYYESLVKPMIDYLKEHDVVASEVHYAELCADQKSVHMHGCIFLKGKFYIEGIIKDMVRSLISLIDKRLQLRWEQNYYHHMMRYRSPMLCIQYSDQIDRIKHWEQYIRKNI